MQFAPELGKTSFGGFSWALEDVVSGPEGGWSITGWSQCKSSSWFQLVGICVQVFTGSVSAGLWLMQAENTF